MTSRDTWRFLALCAALSMSAAAPAVAQDFKADSAKAEEGERVYGNYCQTCHGDGLASNGQTFDLRRLKPEERMRFETAVQNGKNQMPPWKGVVTDAEIEMLWHYIMINRRS